MIEFYPLGKILSAGKDGFVKVQLTLGFIGNIINLKVVYLDFWQKKKKLSIEEVKKIKSTYFFKFINFENERDTSLLLNREIFISENDLNDLGFENSCLIDIIGYKVFRDNCFVGIVTDYFDMPANSVIEIRNEQSEKILIPFVESFIEQIDEAKKELVLFPDRGIYDNEN